MTDREQYRDLRRTEGSSSPAGQLPFGEAKPLRLRRIDPGGALSAPGDPPAPGSGAGAFVLATVPARRGSGRLQALIAALLSFILLGSLAALAVIGSGGLPGAPVVPPGVQLEQEVVRESPVEALLEPAGGVAGAPGPAGPSSAEAPATTPSVVDETEPPGVIPAEGDQDGQGDEGGGRGGGGQGEGGQGGGGGSDEDDAADGNGDTVDEGGLVGGGDPVGETPDGSGDGGGKDEVKAKAIGKGHEKAKGQGHEKAMGKGHQKAMGKGDTNDGDGGGDQVAEPGNDKGKGKGKDKGAAGHPAGAPPGAAGGTPAEGKGKGNGKGSGG